MHRPTDPATVPPEPDKVSLRSWVLFYALLLAGAALVLALLIPAEPWSWADWLHHAGDAFRSTSTTVKLVSVGIYFSLATTLVPLPTSAVLAGMATPAAGLAGSGVWLPLVAIVIVCSIGSTIANLHDYHLYTWMLRNRRIARVRDTHIYGWANRWFSRFPFFLILLFNMVPLPVDASRVVASISRYPRVPFAVANFLGRLMRYAVIALAMYLLGAQGPKVVVAMLGLAGIMVVVRGAPSKLRRLWARSGPARRAGQTGTP